MSRSRALTSAPTRRSSSANSLAWASLNTVSPHGFTKRRQAKLGRVRAVDGFGKALARGVGVEHAATLVANLGTNHHVSIANCDQGAQPKREDTLKVAGDLAARPYALRQVLELGLPALLERCRSGVVRWLHAIASLPS